jgi:MFS family permease
VRDDSYLGLLRRERDFRRVYISQLISLGGDWFALIPLLTLLASLTGSGLYGGLVLAADTATFAVLSPYAGTVVDRVDRRTLMVVADLASAVLVLGLLLVQSSGTAWVALVAIGGVAAAKAFYQPASSAALPNLVDRPDLSRANVLSGASWGTMLAVGAALGGLAAAAVGYRWCFAIDAASFVLSAWLTWRTSRPFQEPRGNVAHSTLREDIKETVDYARTEPRVVALLTCKLGPGLGNGALALYPLFAAIYGVRSLGTGLFFSARGVGALLGPLLLRRYVARDPDRLWVGLAASMLTFGVGYALFGVSPWFAGALALVVVAHLGGGANWIMSSYGLQTIVPDRVRGRVFSADYMIATLAVAASQITTGWLSTRFSPRVISVGLGLVVIGYSAIWIAATRRLREPPRLAAGGELAPTAATGA